MGGRLSNPFDEMIETLPRTNITVSNCQRSKGWEEWSDGRRPELLGAETQLHFRVKGKASKSNLRGSIGGPETVFEAFGQGKRICHH